MSAPCVWLTVPCKVSPWGASMMPYRPHMAKTYDVLNWASHDAFVGCSAPDMSDQLHM